MKNNIRERLIDLLEQADGQVNNDIPSLEMIADYLIANGVVPVVRCRDCKHWDSGYCYRIKLTRPDDYCSYGTPKERCEE